jgi:hypothetical protein
VQNGFVEYDPVNNPEQALFSFQISKGIPNGYLRVSRFDTLYPNATEAFNPHSQTRERGSLFGGIAKSRGCAMAPKPKSNDLKA